MDTKLNRYHLDENAIEQVEMYEDCTDKWADAVLKRDTVKEELSTIKAEVDVAIRANPKKYGWDSASKAPTEAWISNQIILNRRVKEATMEHLQAVYEVNKLVGKKETLEHRKKSLDVLTELYKGQYFVAVSRAEPNYKEKISEEGRRAQEEKLETSRRRRKGND